LLVLTILFRKKSYSQPFFLSTHLFIRDCCTTQARIDVNDVQKGRVGALLVLQVEFAISQEYVVHIFVHVEVETFVYVLTKLAHYVQIRVEYEHIRHGAFDQVKPLFVEKQSRWNRERIIGRRFDLHTFYQVQILIVQIQAKAVLSAVQLIVVFHT